MVRKMLCTKKKTCSPRQLHLVPHHFRCFKMELTDNIELEKRGFKKMQQIAEGSYGVVYIGIEISSGQKVAMKKMKRQSHDEANEGIHFTTIREIKLLSEIRHENILGVLNIYIFPYSFLTWLMISYCQ